MAKKEPEKIEAQEGERPDDSDPGENLLKPPPDTRYTMGEWKGIPQFKCSLCPWDTLSGLAEFDKHWESAHVVKEPPPPPPIIQAADRFGRPVGPPIEIVEDKK